ncbi:uncharacterized protein Dana_GF27419 [Drosophila ananassae]|uniref:Uncharacterized protein n=1 Tax=Drosophila ananassae TaxID=7217 RepID=A0A0P8ZQT8_DROAN|nr:uncharacterized protein Dana_GF27419 [Drosophila ananassae]
MKPELGSRISDSRIKEQTSEESGLRVKIQRVGIEKKLYGKDIPKGFHTALSNWFAHIHTIQTD